MTTQPSSLFAPDFGCLVSDQMRAVHRRMIASVDAIRTWLLLDVMFERGSMEGVRGVEVVFPSTAAHTHFAVLVNGQPVSPWWRWGFVGMTFHLAPADSEVWNKRPAW